MQMKKHSRTLTEFFDRTNRVINMFCVVLMLLIVCSTFLQVFCRKVLNTPLTWSEEFSRLSFVWMNCIGCAIVIRTKQHISFDLFVNKKFSTTQQKWIRIITDTILLAFFIWIIPSSIQLSIRMNRTLSAALRWPAGLFYLSFVVGSVLSVLAYIGDVLEALGLIASSENINNVI